MAINYDKLMKKLEPDRWYTTDELTKAWNISHTVRKARANAMFHQGLLTRRGMTANVQYKIADITDAPAYKKQAEVKPLSTNSLDSLIAAASKVGTENEILKTALKEAKAAIERAFEAIK